MTHFDGAVAVVTGGSRGIGACIADALEQRGWTVARVARSGARFHADISRPDEVERIKAQILGELGTPTVLVNAAGVAGPLVLIKDSDPDEWIATQMINAIGPYLTCRAFVGGMIDAGWGRIVNLTSASSLHTPAPLGSAYATSKAALNYITRYLAAELEGTGVTANVIHPGDVKTAMWADIHEKAAGVGVEDGEGGWVTWVDETGGDPPEKAAKLVLEIVDGDVNGRFLWIEDPLQPPLPSWSDPVPDRLPWD
jgi:NAD(P)-dependent dehydrogenase (short-subunit alcohol dehydrogenase family)